MFVKLSDPEANLGKADKLVAEAVRRGSAVITFPEMWTTGFNWIHNASKAREHEKVIERIAEFARRHKIWINSSTLAANDKGLPSNTSILFDPSGKRAGIYRKIHLFGMINEDRNMAPGDSPCMVDAAWGPTGLAICYDIRFPELFRAYAVKGAKMVLVSAAFPSARLEHWKVLIRARAIEDQMYIVAANQVGTENLGSEGKVAYCGSSAIIDPWGETIIEASQDKEELITATIDMDKVDEVRSKMSVLKDRRPEIYRKHSPQ